MSNTNNSLKGKINTNTIIGLGLLTAIVVVMQFISMGLRFGTFSITLTLIPIVVGSALYGWGSGAWLGFVFGIVVLFTDAGLFLSVSVIGTIVTVLLKGTLCGLCAGAVYKALEKHNRYAAVAVAAAVCPIVNTGVFLLGCSVFFMDTLREWAGGDVMTYIIFTLVGGNFLFEALSNIILSPVIVRILNIRNKQA